jgi:hypothetical protein
VREGSRTVLKTIGATKPGELEGIDVASPYPVSRSVILTPGGAMPVTCRPKGRWAERETLLPLTTRASGRLII